MGSLSRKSWSSGWEPNADPIGGSPNALLRMDNLTLEQTGSVSLMRGSAKISDSGFFETINRLYSRVTDGANLGVSGFPTSAKLRYVSCAGSVFRNYSPGTKSLTTFDLTLFTGGDTSWAAFGTMYGQNIVCSGTKKFKDDGANQRVLTIPANAAPTVSVGAAQIIDAAATTWNTWVAISGGVVNTSTHVGLAPDATDPSSGGRQGEIQWPANATVATIDTTNFGGVTHSDDDGDIFNLVVSGSAISYCTSITVRFLLITPPSSSPSLVTDYYETFFGLELGTLPNTDATTSTLTCFRRDFTRAGTNPSLDWSTVKGIQVILEAGHKGSGISIYNMDFCRALTGKYQYYQVDVRRDPNYLEIGLPSPVSAEYTLSQAMATVTAHAPDAQATEVWIFRINQYGPTATTTPFRVMVLTSAFTTPFLDTLSDSLVTQDAISDPTAVMRQYAVAVPDNIQHIVAPISDRCLYFDKDTMYVSYQLDFGSIDSRHEFTICANASEKILWVRMVIDGYVLVGTTKDIYRIISTYEEDSNGLITIDIRGMGLTQPPISSAYTMWGTFLVYLSSEGWKYLAGSVTDTFSGQLSLLYRGFSRQGLNGINAPQGNSPSFYCASASNRIYCTVVDSAGNGLIHCYDFLLKTWTMWSCQDNQPGVIYAEEDGTIIYGTNSSGDDFLRQFDVGTLLDGATAQSFKFTTIFDDNEVALQRKEVQDFKIDLVADGLTGTITLNGINYDGTTSAVALAITLTGTKQFILDASALGSPTRIQVDFTGTATTLHVTGFEVTYADHTSLLTTLVVPPMNYGMAQRKRIRILPHVFDTLGNTITITPFADSVSLAPFSFSSTEKRTALVQITTDAYAVDWGIRVSGGPFEYYGAINPAIAQTIPVETTYWQIGPIELNQRGTFRKLRIRMFPNGASLDVRIFAQDNTIYDKIVTTVPYNEDNYTLEFPMGIGASISRIELRMSEGFSYYYAELWTKETGNQTEWEKKRV
jgi:hypothetical protein